MILPLVGRYGGRIIDTAGSGILAEFPSMINPIECAVEIRAMMATRNEEMLESRRMQCRIGINLGDVIHDEPGSTATASTWRRGSRASRNRVLSVISRQVFDEASRALKANFQALGLRTLGSSIVRWSARST